MTTRPGPYEVLENERTFDALEAFEAAAARRGIEPATLAIAWVLSDPRVTALVVGPRNPTQLDSALAGLALRLSPAERDELAELFP
jgi:aryl-alcohol dehydrogenase-like predicted oxidoreductase